MNWQYVNTGENTGSFNMDFDLNLMKEAASDNTVLRLYRWKPYCISLGANQNISEINGGKAKSDGIDIVRRPTGGRAILHSEELTYSVVMPLSFDSSPRDIYRQINFALLEGLRIYDPGLAQLELEAVQPDLLASYKEISGALCFGVPAKSEIKYSGKKLVGSAQRKLGNSLLQHGSIMCGSYHLNLADYLNLCKEEIISVKNDLKNKTTELETILHYETDYTLLEESVVAGFEKFFGIRTMREELSLK